VATSYDRAVEKLYYSYCIRHLVGPYTVTGRFCTVTGSVALFHHPAPLALSVSGLVSHIPIVIIQGSIVVVFEKRKKEKTLFFMLINRYISKEGETTLICVVILS
jgi:hypothetical protein